MVQGRKNTSSKWPAGVTGRDTVAAAARGLLKWRLGQVAIALESLAGTKPLTPRAAHQLRVATRRGAAAIELFRGIIPRRQRRRWLRRLRKIRRAVARVREFDVLLGKPLKNSPREVRDAFVLRRQSAERRLKKWRRPTKAARWNARLDALLRRVPRRRSAADATPFAAWARRLLAAAAAEISHSSVIRPGMKPRAATQRLHALRIALKHLRYVIELVAPAVPVAARTSVYPRVVALQDKLGAINDAATARDHFERILRRAPADIRPALERLRAAAERDLSRRTREFLARWNKSEHAALRRAVGRASHPGRGGSH